MSILTKKPSTAVAIFLLCTAVPAFALDVTLRLDPENDALSEKLRAASLLVGLREKDPSPQDILAAAKADYERLIGALYRDAYYAPVIEIRLDGAQASAIPLVSAPTQVANATVQITLGSQFRFGAVSASPLAPDTVLPDQFKTGAIAGVEVLRATTDASLTAWRARGHAMARIATQDITANHPNKDLNAAITIDPGPRLRFGDLIVTGDTGVRTDRIIDIAGLPSGSVFSPKEIARATTRLQRTGSFRVASLTQADVIGANQTIDVTAQITQGPPRRFGIGAEVSSLDGFGVSGFWLHRNLLGGAERLRLEGDISGIGGNSGGVDYRLGLRFDRPATFNEDTDFYIESALERRDEVAFTSNSFAIEAGINRYASQKRTYSLGLGYRFSDVKDAFGERSYSIITLPASTTFDYRDDKLDATSGYFAKASLTPFLNLSGTKNGVRGLVDLRAYKTFDAAPKITFAARGQMGSIVGPNLEDTPTDFLFYSGGGGTVRGQEYQSLSVDLGNGRTVGGRSFLGVSGEIRAQVRDAISLVGFYDAGYIGTQEIPDGTSGTWHTGAGLGVRYDTGLGPIRLDVAVPLSGPNNASGVEVYIGIGQAF